MTGDYRIDIFLDSLLGWVVIIAAVLFLIFADPPPYPYASQYTKREWARRQREKQKAREERKKKKDETN